MYMYIFLFIFIFHPGRINVYNTDPLFVMIIRGQITLFMMASDLRSQPLFLYNTLNAYTLSITSRKFD